MSDASSWVQAGASLVLIGITWRYVVITGRMAQSASTQAKMMEDQRELDRELRLSAVLLSVTRLKSALEALPGPDSEGRADRMIRQFALWSPQELEVFAAGSARLGAEVAHVAAGVVDDFKWLGERVSAVRATSEFHGYDYASFPWAEWHTRSSNAQDGLARIEAAVGEAHSRGV